MRVRKLLASTTLAAGLVGAGAAGVSTVIGSTATAGAPSHCVEWRVCRDVPVEIDRNPLSLNLVPVEGGGVLIAWPGERTLTLVP